MTATPRSYTPVLIALLVPPLLLAGALLWVSAQLVLETAGITQANELLRISEAALSALKDAEAGQRGYLLTDESEFLEPYELALAQLPEHLEQLDQLTADSPTQQVSVNRIRDLIDRKLEELASTVELRRQDRSREAVAIVREGTGRELMNSLRVEIDRINDSALLSLNANRDSQRRLSFLFTGLALAAVLFSGIGMLLLYRIGAAQEAAKTEAKTAALLQINQSLEDFARIAAHDLRAPARTAISLLQLGKRKLGSNRTDDSDDMFDRVENTLRRQLQLTDDLLTYQQAASEALPDPAPVDVAQCVSQVIENLDEVIRQHDARVIVGALPTFRAHSSLVMLLFQNLIENAIKHRHPDRNPIVKISATRENSGWVFRIEDNGQGIDPQYLERVFQPFVRLSTAQPGSGVGLATCTRIAERSGGRIWAESKLGVGSVFYVVFPDV